MEVLKDWTEVASYAPKIYLIIRYEWNASTRQVRFQGGRRCGSSGAWWSVNWYMTISDNLDHSTGSVHIKNSNTGTIGKTEYGTTSGWWTVPNNVNSVTVTVSTTPNGESTSATLNVGYGYQAAGQTFVTKVTNNTSGYISNSGDVGITTNKKTDVSGDTSKSYAGDSFTYVWDKNSPDSRGTGADPANYADLIRGGTRIYTAWNQSGDIWDYSGDDKYLTYSRTATIDDYGSYLGPRIYKAHKNSYGANYSYYEQYNRMYIQPRPSISCSVSLRSARFYTSTPSLVVYRVNSLSATTNGYGMSNDTTNNNSAGRTNGGSVPYKFGISLCLSGGVGGWDVRIPSSGATFNGNYSMSTVLDLHSASKYQPGAPDSNAGPWINVFNPRTGAAGRLEYLSTNIGTFNRVSGSITLPKITSITPISGNGTTVIVDSSKRIYTNQSNVNITWKVVDGSGNSNFGYDIRETDNSGTWASGNFSGGPVGIRADGWKIDCGAATTTITHSGMTTTGVNRSVTIVPYVTDSGGYKIFGDQTGATKSSASWNMKLIQVPSGLVFNSWSNTLPAIDGVKDYIKYTCTSPSSWGNVTDFSYGYKMRYKIGSDTTRSDGYQWLFLSTPTTTSTSFSGTFTQTYNRSLNTSCTAQICATNYYSAVWNSNLAFQSAYTAEKSFAIAAKKPYSKTSCTVSTTYTTTLDTEVTYKIACPSQTINGNTLVQTTTLKVDSNNPITIDNPTYSTSTPNSLSGDLTLSFSNLTQRTPTLSRGAHTLYVENEVVTYFDSVDPANHVYFGTTTLKSNVLNIEVAVLPSAPSIQAPNPLTFQAGQARTLTFKYTPNDWGCLDTTYNYRRYEYELYDPNNEIIASGYLAQATSSYSHTITPISPDNEGTYKFKLREVTIVGVSPWSERSITITKATEPACSVLNQSNVLALPNWEWDYTWTPGNNGTYKPR